MVRSVKCVQCGGSLINVQQYPEALALGGGVGGIKDQNYLKVIIINS